MSERRSLGIDATTSGAKSDYSDEKRRTRPDQLRRSKLLCERHFQCVVNSSSRVRFRFSHRVRKNAAGDWFFRAPEDLLPVSYWQILSAAKTPATRGTPPLDVTWSVRVTSDLLTGEGRSNEYPLIPWSSLELQTRFVHEFPLERKPSQNDRDPAGLWRTNVTPETRDIITLLKATLLSTTTKGLPQTSQSDPHTCTAHALNLEWISRCPDPCFSEGASRPRSSPNTQYTPRASTHAHTKVTTHKMGYHACERQK